MRPGKAQAVGLRAKGWRNMAVVTTIVGVLALVAMGYLTVLLLGGGERR